MVVYHRQYSKRLAIQRQDRVEEELDTKKETKLNTFLRLTSAVINIIKSHIDNIKDGSIDNTMGMPSLDIIKSRKLNENGNLCFDLQKRSDHYLLHSIWP